MKRKKERNKKVRMIGFLCGLLTVFSLGTVGIKSVDSYAATNAKEVTSYFSASDGVELLPGVDTPSYVDNSRNSLLVDSVAGGTVTYNNVIDATKLTKNQALFEIQPMPDTMGVAEMTRMIVRLEDAENSKVFVNLSLRRYTFSDGAPLTHILAQPNTVQSYLGYCYDKGVGIGVSKNVQHGTMVTAQWKGADRGYSNGIKIFYDNEEKAIYAQEQPGWNTTYVDEQNRLLVLDMDTPAHMGADKSALWGGFPSGKMKISFSTTELIADHAKYMIYDIDGQAFDGKYLNDVTAPDLTVDTQGYESTSLPLAQVGRTYPFFAASAVDKISGVVPVKVRVYKDGNEQYHTGKGFTPTEEGEYEIEYVASDENANMQISRFTVTAIGGNAQMQHSFNILQGELDLTDEELKNADGNFPVALYAAVRLPSMAVVSDFGNADVSVAVYHGSREIKIENGQFIPKWKGLYEVVYTAKDYVGNIQTFSFVLEASLEEVPRLQKPVLPYETLIDKMLKLPKVESEYYTEWNQRKEGYNVITVYKADGETVLATFDGSVENFYVPQASDGESIIVEYSAAKDANSEKAVYRQEIVLYQSVKLSDRFIYDEESVSVFEDALSLDFTFENENATVTYINKLSVYDTLSLEFLVFPERNGFDEIRFTFVDSENADIMMTVSIFKNPDPESTKSFIVLNGNTALQSEIDSSFWGNISSRFLFTLLKDGSVKHSDLGNEPAPNGFGGFTSGYVYMSVSLHGFEADETEKTLSLMQIKNQILGEQDYDFIKPILYIVGEPVGIVDLGATVIIPSARACDVYDQAVNLKVEVTFGEKKVFSMESMFGETEQSYIIATDYGEYSISYTATDTSGNSIVKRYTVRVRDRIAPKLTVEGEMPKEATAGKKFEYPNATATDNVDVRVKTYIIIIDPMNCYNFLLVGEKYVPTMRGRYIVQYYCEDSSYNQTYSEFYYVDVK